MKKHFLLLFLLHQTCGLPHRITARSAKNEYKMCVPEQLLALCQQMSGQETKSPARIVCLPARDRYECIEKIQQRVADFGAVDPEDMYIAARKPQQDFTVFEEIRTREEPEEEFRYEAVAVVRKNLQINSLEDLKGLNSCHTGVGRNVGYKIPLTKLKQRGIIGQLNEPDLSPRENELKAFSQLFHSACIVGKWSEEPKINLEWKKKYANLCALCEHPDICDYPDTHSGYDGALRCLAHFGGQIAWTKVIYVRKFFGLPVGLAPAKPTKLNLEDFAYLCPDGTKVPINEKPCRWAARPWPGYMSNADVVKNADELRKKIDNLYTAGSKSHADWLQKVLELDDRTLPKENKPISPGDYLDKANYTDVIERDYGPPFKTVRFCVSSSEEKDKCQALAESAFSRNLRPRFGCVQEKSTVDCLKTIRDNGADVATLGPNLVDLAQRDYNLRAIVSEQYGNTEYVVAVVRKDSKLEALADLKGAKVCQTAVGSIAALYQLIRLNVIAKNNCSKALSATNYDSDSEALKCLVDGADVALIQTQNVDLKDFELLCPNGGRKTIEQVHNCYLAQPPPRMVVTNNIKTDAEIDEIRHLLVSTSAQYSQRSDLFRLFGSFKGQKDLLFRDSATGLVSVLGESEVQKEYSKVLHACN